MSERNLQEKRPPKQADLVELQHPNFQSIQIAGRDLVSSWCASASAFVEVASFREAFEAAFLEAWDAVCLGGTCLFPSCWTLACVGPLISCCQFESHSFVQLQILPTSLSRTIQTLKTVGKEVRVNRQHKTCEYFHIPCRRTESFAFACISVNIYFCTDHVTKRIERCR